MQQLQICMTAIDLCLYAIYLRLYLFHITSLPHADLDDVMSSSGKRTVGLWATVISDEGDAY